MYGKGSYFQISKKKSIFRRNFIREDMFYYARGIKLNNEITNWSKLVKFIV